MRSRLMQYRSDPLMQYHSGVDTLASAHVKLIGTRLKLGDALDEAWMVVVVHSMLS